jgi:hypothetical protein
MALKDVFLGKQSATVRDTGTQMVLDLGTVPEGYRALADKLTANTDSAVLKIQHSVTKAWQVSVWQLQSGTPNFLIKNDWNNVPLDSSNSGLYLTLVAGDSYIVESVAYPAKILCDSSGIIEINGALTGCTPNPSKGLAHSSNGVYAAFFDNGILQHDSADTGALTVDLDDITDTNNGNKLHIINPVGAGVVNLQVVVIGKTLKWLPSGTTGNRVIAAGGYAEIIKDYYGNFIIVNGVGIS